MPLPKPNSGQKEKNFMENCMSSPTMNKEYKDAQQRAAVCYSQFRRRKSKANWDDVEKDGFIFLA